VDAGIRRNIEIHEVRTYSNGIGLFSFVERPTSHDENSDLNTRTLQLLTIDGCYDKPVSSPQGGILSKLRSDTLYIVVS
jgi:hypothetical protein